MQMQDIWNWLSNLCMSLFLAPPESVMNFVERMLMFSNLRENYYQGFVAGNPAVDVEIIKKGKLVDLEEFLNSVDVE